MRKWAEMGCWERRFFAVESFFYSDTQTLLNLAHGNIAENPQDPFFKALLQWFSVEWGQSTEKTQHMQAVIKVLFDCMKHPMTQSAVDRAREGAETLDYADASALLRKATLAFFIAGLIFTGGFVSLVLAFPAPLIAYAMYGWIMTGELLLLGAGVFSTLFGGLLASYDTPQKQIEISLLRLERDISPSLSVGVN